MQGNIFYVYSTVVKLTRRAGFNKRNVTKFGFVQSQSVAYLPIRPWRKAPLPFSANDFPNNGDWGGGREEALLGIV